jgi:periplasmic protein CpxP/Spy
MSNVANKSVKMLLTGMAIVALSANAFARDMEDCRHDERGNMGMNPERMEKYQEQHLSKLHEKLKLTPQQEAAWTKFAADRPLLQRPPRPNPEEMAKLSAPQRLEKGLERMHAMEARLSEHLAKLKEFYAVLTPEQQKIFDAQTPKFGARWERRG